MSDFFTEVLNILPLKVDSASYISGNLELQGRNWGFKTKACWYIIDEKKMLCGCYDDKSSDVLKGLIGMSVISITAESIVLPIDPVLVFSNGHKIKFFSTKSDETWSFLIPSGILYIGNK